jgi:hypothetical protein
MRRASLGAACALVLAIFWGSAHPGLLGLLGGGPAQSYYNLLVEGFQDGHLSLRKEVPPGLEQLADPYDPAANHPYRTLPTLADDLSYVRGRFYIYFGITPALLLFWPWAALTGHYLGHAAAVAAFCSIGFLAAAWLLGSLARLHFPAAAPGVTVAGTLALGLATGLPVMLQRSDVYEVSISCAYMLIALALGALWQALHAPARNAAWLAVASLLLGLAVGARPPVLFCAFILLAPVLAASAGRLRLLLAAVLPLGCCGLGLMLYNLGRFGSPFEFGQHYQLSGIRQDTVRHFSPSYLWFNLRVYFLEPLRWQPHFPFVANIVPPPLPPGHGIVEKPFSPFGVLPTLPFAGFALAAPLALRRVPDAGDRRRLGWFLAATAALFAVPALVTCLFFGTCSRYEVEFLPALILLAAVGVLALETAPARLPFIRAAWVAALVFSIACDLGASFERYGLERIYAGAAYFDLGRLPEAIGQFRAALRLVPESADAHLDLGVALARSDRLPEATAEFAAALRADPGRADAYDDLGLALAQAGRTEEAIAQYRESLRLRPASARAHYNLAVSLQKAGRGAEARAEYGRAVRLDPSLGRP